MMCACLVLSSLDISQAQKRIDLDKFFGDVRILAPAARDELGTSVAHGDVNGDGIADMIVGAPGEFGTQHKGEVYVIYGSSRFRPAKEIDLSTTQADITIHGQKVDDRFGFALAAGDINNDGVDDIVAAARFGDPPGRADAGIVYVIYGSRQFPPNLDIDLNTTPADITILGENAGDFLGGSLEGRGLASGDINGDGADDLIMGASWADPAGRNRAGKVYVIFGSGVLPANHSFDLGSVGADITILGKTAVDGLGHAVDAGDVNGDGYDEIIVSGWGADVGARTKAGEVYVIYGAPVWVPFNVIDLNSASANITIQGESTNFFTGDQLASGDINNDGYHDIFVGASFASPGGQLEIGRAYVVWGSNAFPAIHNIDLAAAADITILGEAIGDRLGSSLAAGDVNADGIDDLIVGAMKADSTGRLNAGKVYAIFGGFPFVPNHVIDLSVSPADLTIVGDDASDQLGRSVTSADFDGSAVDDFFLGANGADPPGGANAGEAVLIYGACAVSPPSMIALINGVPDVNQPPAATLLSTQPLNYCAPMAAINILAYWDTSAVHSNATGVNAGLPLKEASEYLGYFMDTNDTGSPDRVNGRTQPSKTGTYVRDQFDGLIEYIRWDSSHAFLTPPPNFPANKNGYNWSVGIDSLNAFSLVQSEIDSGRPVKIDFLFWNPVRTGAFVIEPTTGDTVHVYKWGQPIPNSTENNEGAPNEEWNFEDGSQGIGHAVTGVGYIGNWNPGCAGLPSGNYVIVHDNWPTTPEKVAVSWAHWNMTITLDPTPPPTPICKFIPKVPDENQPPASGQLNWCAPTAAVNIVDYWDNVLRQSGAQGVMDSWTRATANDEIGWFMDTNDMGSPNRFNTVPNSGTYNVDIGLGLDEFVQWDASSLFGYVPPPATKNGYSWSILTDYVSGFSFHKFEIDNGRPTILTFLYWNPQKTTYSVMDTTSGELIQIYAWGNATQNPVNAEDPFEEWNFEEDSLNIGHAVTGVGYWENFDPDGRGNKFSPSTWVIVHDNWSSTAKHVAIPWQHWTGTVAVKVTPITAVESDMRGTVVEEFSLYQNYPNPFNPETVISFTVKISSHVMLKVYDLLGNEVRILADELYPAGVHRVRLDASDMAAGVYLYRIQMGDFEAVRKMVVLR
jgi:hypothetical protein